MSNNNGILFAFSGPRANKKEEVFYEAQRLMREKHPDLPIQFMDNVVSKKPLPFHWDEQDRDLHPTTRLVKAFAEFNEAGVKMIRPAIEAGKIVVTLRYGLDVFLDSIAGTDCEQAKAEAGELWHRHLVPARVIRGTPKPQYLINRVLKPTESNVMDFCSRQERDIEKYFEGTGQKPPIYLTGKTVQQCAEEAIQHILASFVQYRDTVTA